MKLKELAQRVRKMIVARLCQLFLCCNARPVVALEGGADLRPLVNFFDGNGNFCICACLRKPRSWRILLEWGGR